MTLREVLARVVFPEAFRDAEAARQMLLTLRNGPSRRWIMLDGPAMRRIADAYEAVDKFIVTYDALR